jgi:hypothetical protein
MGHIPTELIRTESETTRAEIHNLINSIRNNNDLPDQWMESIIVPV